MAWEFPDRLIERYQNVTSVPALLIHDLDETRTTGGERLRYRDRPFRDWFPDMFGLRIFSHRRYLDPDAR